MIRLLIVDDHEMVREGLKAMLVTEPDFTIVGEAATAEQAFACIERAQPDIILLDIRLPGSSGIEVCRAVSEQYPEVAVIILTTFTDETLIAQCIQAGARGFIVKDIERFDLKGIVTGKTHLCVQRDPRVPHFLWWHEDVYEQAHALAPVTYCPATRLI